MKRSNRLVLLVGVFLAIVAFIGILLISQGSGGNSGEPEVITELPTVIAKADIPLGSRIKADQVEVVVKPISGRDADAFGDSSQVIGKIVRENVATGAAITAATLTGAAPGQILDIDVPPTLRAITVQVDQVTGVGTVIKTGDFVDMVVGFTGDKFPVITLNAQDDTFTVVSGLNSTSVKALLQGMQVLGTLLPPPPASNTTAEDPNAPPAGESGTALNGQQQIVALAVTAQQAEIIKFAQLDGNISLVLRSPDDFLDEVTGEPIVPVPDVTTGLILKTLVDTYGVLPPELVETVLPAQPTP
ncbi:MAG: Flp pilus assembly protein CpaB [Candidatus Limnocylindrales bacterium]